MARIKIKNASVCTDCMLHNNCAREAEYNSLLSTLNKIADLDNSLNVTISVKCKNQR